MELGRGRRRDDGRRRRRRRRRRLVLCRTLAPVADAGTALDAAGLIEDVHLMGAVLQRFPGLHRPPTWNEDPQKETKHQHISTDRSPSTCSRCHDTAGLAGRLVVPSVAVAVAVAVAVQSETENKKPMTIAVLQSASTSGAHVNSLALTFQSRVQPRTPSMTAVSATAGVVVCSVSSGASDVVCDSRLWRRFLT